jgi:hypothetical protein
MRQTRLCLLCFLFSAIVCRKPGWLAFLGPSSLSFAHHTYPAFRGTWTSTVGTGQTFRGAWSGQTSPQSPNTVRGSWTLFNEANEIVLQGTWSAQKTSRGWQGTWTARAANGASFSGTWYADLPDFRGKTMEDMLKRTTEKQVAGSWRSSHYQGNWWLDGR